MNVEERIRNIKPLYEKEEYVTKLLDTLDKETFELFKELVDLSEESVYKLTTLYKRAICLSDMYSQTLDAVNVMLKEEANNYSLISGKYQFRYLLISITTFTAFMANALLGIASFILLSRKNNKDFANEIMGIYDAIDKLSCTDEKSPIIHKTLDNCARMLDNKKDIIMFNCFDPKNDMSERLRILISNDAITGYINGEVSFEQIMQFTEVNKNSIINILRQDLNIDTDDLEVLLGLAKENNDNGMKLVMEYQND